MRIQTPHYDGQPEIEPRLHLTTLKANRSHLHIARAAHNLVS